MNVINYNFKKHLELLNHQKNVISQNKSFFNENRSEFWELNRYNIAVDQHIFWENRFEVASLIQTFLNHKITAEEFHDSVFGLRRNHMNKCNQFLSKLVSGEIKEFFPNKESYKLEGFLSSLYFECEHFEMNWDEEAFYNSILNGFLKFQKILKEDRRIMKNSMDFSELVDRLNWETKEQYFELIEGFLDESSNFLNVKKRYESTVTAAEEFESNFIFLKPSYQALGFSNYIHILIQLFDDYQIDYNISPRVFKYWVRKILFEMKNHYS